MEHRTSNKRRKPNKVQARLLSFMQSSSPTELQPDSNLPSPLKGDVRKLSAMRFTELCLYAKEQGVASRAANMAVNRNELIELIYEARSSHQLTRTGSRALTRQESIEALQSLSVMGQVNRQVSIDRLPSVDRLPSIDQLIECPPLTPIHPEHSRNWQLVLHRLTVHERTSSVRAYVDERNARETAYTCIRAYQDLSHRLSHARKRIDQAAASATERLEVAQTRLDAASALRRRFANATRSADDLSRVSPSVIDSKLQQLTSKIDQETRDQEQVLEMESCCPNALPDPSPEDSRPTYWEARWQEHKPEGQQNRAEHALKKLAGHGLPYAWQLSHELMVDDDFEFSTDGLVLPDPAHRRFVRLFLKAADDQQQQQLLGALLTIWQQGSSTDALEAVVGKTTTQIEQTLHGSVGAATAETLDAAYICQMVSKQAYGPDQLLRLLRHICQLATSVSVLEHPAILDWLASAESQLAQERPKEQTLALAAGLLIQLVAQLRQLRTTEMNIRLQLYRPSFRKVGAEYERLQVAAAVESGQLKLSRTAPWLDAAHKRLSAEPQQLSKQVMISTHREAWRLLLHDLALENRSQIKTERLPEILALDTHRIGTFRAQLRRLSIGVALYTLCVSVLKAAGVLLNEDERDGLQKDVLQALSNAANSKQLAQAVAALLQVAAGDKYSKLPSKDQLVDALKTASSRREAGNLRNLFTKRVVAAVVTVGDLHVHQSLNSVKEEVQELACRVNNLCSHLEDAYSQLFVALLASSK